MKSYIMISTTFQDKKEAEEIGNLLLSQRLISCYQLSEIASSYHWKGKIEREKEFLMQMKTRKKLYSKVEQLILKHHSYEIPQIIAYDITNGYQKYLDWIEEETTDSLMQI